MNQQFYIMQPLAEVENLFINTVKVIPNRKTNVNDPQWQNMAWDTSMKELKFSHISNFGVPLEVQLVVVLA